MNLDQARQTFVAESHELLDAMEEALLRLENKAEDTEAVNALFRAAHTIKGSAGLFGFEPIVAFTHVTENVLDRVRGGAIALNRELTALMLASGDHVGRLVDRIAGENGEPDDLMRAEGAKLLKRLKAVLGEGAAPASALSAPDDTVSNDAWHISLRFGRDVLRHGMDPMSFIRYLARLGEISSIQTIVDALPAADAMDPESCYLGFEIDLKSTAAKEDIEGAFEFVREDCTLRILPPHGRLSDYARLLSERPEEQLRLGELLVTTGALTARELEEALQIQTRRSTSASDAPAAQPLGEILVAQGMVQQPLVDAALEKQKTLRDTKSAEARLIRVSADKLDRLINLVGELVIAADGANLHAQRLNDDALHETASLLTRLVSEIRDSSLGLRMVQIGDTFNRFFRVVHDVSRDLGKDIGLEVNGKETELDKSVIERISDPLMHLVRNAMDHGIEDAAVRRARGKPERGTVRLDARHDAGSIVVEVADDGQGLDRDRILKKAIERGLVAADSALTDEQVWKLIFEPGFSTADKVTNLSGRGVGMDVVRRNVEALRGTIEIESCAGTGTTFRVRLPLTLAIIDGFLMKVADSSFVVPLDLVVECIELSQIERRALRGRNYLSLRGEVLPFLRLRELFDLGGTDTRSENVVVVQYAGHKAGLMVDQMLGEFQTVIKPLGRLFQHLRGVSGSTILGSGEVALILDVPALVQRVIAREQLETTGGARRVVAGR